MTDMYFLVLTAINLFALAFMCVLVSLNDTLNPKQTRGFLYTFLLIALISILELITVLVDGGPHWMRPINIISNYLGFSLTPAVPLVMVYTIDQTGQTSEKSAGTFLGADKKGVNVVCGDGKVLRILELQAPGKKRMRTVDYLRGHQLFD